MPSDPSTELDDVGVINGESKLINRDEGLCRRPSKKEPLREDF
jgi:hypothetical protein